MIGSGRRHHSERTSFETSESLMSGASVKRIESITEFRSRLIRYQQTLGNDLDELAIVLTRIEQTFVQDIPAYWRHQTQLAERRLAEAENHLDRVQSTVRQTDRPPATEAKQRLTAARQRHRHCTEQCQRAKQIAQSIAQQTDRIRGPLGTTRGIADADLTAATDHLRSIVEHLRRYLS